MQSVYHLVYASSASCSFSETELDALLAIARENNRRLNITGLLLFADGNFIQILEGEKNSVEALFSHIEADNRHKGVIRLLSRTSDARMFSNWTMGYRRLRGDDLHACVPGFNDLLTHDKRARKLQGNIEKGVWMLLASFRQIVNT